MALLLRTRTDNEKGAIVFTHKEIDNGPVSMRNEPRILKKLVNLREKFFLGVHIGGALPEFPAFDLLDFYMAPESTRFIKYSEFAGKRLFKREAKVFHIPLCARNFLPDEFGALNCSKYFDIIMIARAAVNKHIDKFFDSVKKIYGMGKKYKVLLISADANKEGAVDVAGMYYRMFSAEERDLLTLNFMSNGMSMFPLPSSTIAFLLSSSKVCALFSMEEGDSRNIHEALMAGLPVVVCKNMVGGARDYLDSNNSVQFPEFRTAHEALIHAVENHSSFRGIREQIEPLCSESHSIARLEDFLQELHGLQKAPYTRGRLNSGNLSLSLAAHTRDRTPDGLTLDLMDSNRMLAWLDEALK